MGLIMSILENGFYAGPIFYAAEKEAERICKNLKCTAIDEDEDEEDSDEDENAHLFMMTVRKNGSIGTTGETGHCGTEAIKGKFDRQDIFRNIAAAVNHFGISDSEDMQITRTHVAAILYMSGLSDADTVFEALNKDATAYAVVNELVRKYSGEAMDEKLVQTNAGKEADDTVRRKLKRLADWELDYLTGHIHADSDGLADRAKEVHAAIMDCLDRQSKEYAYSGQDMRTGGDGDNV